MMPPRIFKPHNSLADRLHDRRGVDAQTATKQAQAAIKRVEPRALAEVDRALALLTHDLTAFRASHGEALVFEGARVYAAADVMVGLAPAFELPALGEAAASLCKLVSDEGVVRPEAIAVHVEALMLIRRDEAMGEFVLPGLRLLSTPPPEGSAGPVEPAVRPQALA